jgi:hypothetical protein
MLDLCCNAAPGPQEFHRARSVGADARLGDLQPKAALGILTLLDAASPLEFVPVGLCFNPAPPAREPAPTALRAPLIQ